jgi:hypothetical protein
MAKPQLLWVVRTRIHRLVRWIDGVETEFPIAFSHLSVNEQTLIAAALATICAELDDYQDNGCMSSVAAVISIQEERTAKMENPKRDEPESGF